MAHTSDNKFFKKSDEDEVNDEGRGEGLREMSIKLERQGSQRDTCAVAVDSVQQLQLKREPSQLASILSQSTHIPSQPTTMPRQRTSMPARPTVVVSQRASMPQRPIPGPVQLMTDPSQTKPRQSQPVYVPIQSTLATSKPSNHSSQLSFVPSQPRSAPFHPTSSSLSLAFASSHPRPVPLWNASVSMESKAVQTDASFLQWRYLLVTSQGQPVPSPLAPLPPISSQDSSHSSDSSPENHSEPAGPEVERQTGGNAREQNSLSAQASNAQRSEGVGRNNLQQHQWDQQVERSLVTRPSAPLLQHSINSRASGRQLPFASHVMQEYPASGQASSCLPQRQYAVGSQVDWGNNWFPSQYIFRSTVSQRQRVQNSGTATSASFQRELPRETVLYSANSFPQERMQQYEAGRAQNQYRYAPYPRAFSAQITNGVSGSAVEMPARQIYSFPLHEGSIINIDLQSHNLPTEMVQVVPLPTAPLYIATGESMPAQNQCAACTFYGTPCPMHTSSNNGH